MFQSHEPLLNTNTPH